MKTIIITIILIIVYNISSVAAANKETTKNKIVSLLNSESTIDLIRLSVNNGSNSNPDFMLNPPGQIKLKWIEDSANIRIDFYDSSSNEKGFRIYRSHNDSAIIEIMSIDSSLSNDTGWVTVLDSNVTLNGWYSYKIEVFNDSSSKSKIYNIC